MNGPATTSAYQPTGISDWLSDTSNDILKRIAAGAVEANQWMMLKAIDLINGGLRVNLGANWIQNVLTTMRYLVLPVVAVLFVLQIITALLARSPGGLWRAVWGSALGLIFGSGCAVLTAGLLLIVDQFSAYLLGDAQVAAQDGIKKAFAMDGAIEGSGWLVVTIIAALGILAWAMVIVVLFLRKAMIIGTVVFGPFAMAGLASGKTKNWATKWFEVVFALALSKFAISAILTLAYSAVASSITGDITDALLGSVWVLLAALSPLAVMRFVHFAGDQIGSANVSGAAGALGNAKQAAGMGMAGAGAAGGVIGGAAGWLAGRAGNSSRSAAALTPASAVSSRGRASRSAAQSSGDGGATAVGPGSSSSPQLTNEPTAGVSEGGMDKGGADTGSADLQQSPIATAVSPPPARTTERSDGQMQPAMDAFVAQAASGSKTSVVTPSAAASHLGVPPTQADRMFMHYEAQGVLGPQEQGGSRRILAAPSTDGKART